jgi:hypothetical protein
MRQISLDDLCNASDFKPSEIAIVKSMRTKTRRRTTYIIISVFIIIEGCASIVVGYLYSLIHLLLIGLLVVFAGIVLYMDVKQNKKMHDFIEGLIAVSFDNKHNRTRDARSPDRPIDDTANQ